MTLKDDFARSLAESGLSPGPLLAAVSGGADSVALLDLLVSTRPQHGHEIFVAHADHGISAESPTVALQVRALSTRYGLVYHEGQLRLGSGTSETTARAARYLWLEQTRIESGATTILTAHHSDDQVETVLMRVLSGSGPAGLAGMLPRNGRIVRPLLPFRRKELVQYLLDRGISFWEDPSNRDGRHLRSWIRDSVLPGLEARIPELRNRLSEVASQANLNRNAWDALVTADVVLNWREDHGVASVAASSLRTYDSPLAVALIMAVARRSGLVLGPASAHRLCAFAGVAASGSALDLSQGWRAELSFGRLRIVPPVSDNIPDSLGFATMQGSTRWGRWGIDWMTDEAPTFQKRNGTSAWFIPGSVAVRSWRPGDRISPLGGRGHRPVVRCFQDAQISVTARRRWPVFNDRQGGVLWVPGVCRSSAGIPAPGAEALRVDVIHD